jgi:aminoglycoside 2'-N-acetyltransferase I
MTASLSIEIKGGDALSLDEYTAVLTLCSDAFEEEMEPYFRTFSHPIHVLAVLDGKLISHALWITRWLQLGDFPLLRTAYVEAVATDESFRRHGYSSHVLSRLQREIQDYDIGALSPAETSLYERLGWEYWQGPLYARKDDELILLPDETAMILRTSNTPALNIQAPLSIEWREGEIW